MVVVGVYAAFQIHEVCGWAVVGATALLLIIGMAMNEVEEDKAEKELEKALSKKGPAAREDFR